MHIRATIRPGPSWTQLLATWTGDDCLKAVLPARPHHPRALRTLLHGLSLWSGLPIHAAIAAEHSSMGSLVEDLCGTVWPDDDAMVHFDVLRPDRRRIRGPGDFGQLYLLHGRG